MRVEPDEVTGVLLWPGMTLAGAVVSVLTLHPAFILAVPLGPVMAGISVLIVLRRREERRAMWEALGEDPP